MKMTTQGSTFVTTSRSDSKYIGRNRARKFRNPNFQHLICEVWFVFIVIHHHGEVPRKERNKIHIIFGHCVAGFAAAYPGLFSTICCTVCGMNQAKIPPRGARRGGYESNCCGPAAGGGRRKKMGPGRVSGFFETGNFYRRLFRR